MKKPQRIRSVFLLACFAFSALFFASCASKQVVTTDYETSYHISLDSLPAELGLDSGRVNVFVDGVLDTSFAWTGVELAQRKLSFVVSSLDGQNVKLDYSIYSGGQLVASGTDIFDPEAPETSTTSGSIDRNTVVIQKILAGSSSSLADTAQPQSSSSSLDVSSEAVSSGQGSSSVDASSEIILSSSTAPMSDAAASSSSAVALTDFTVDFVTASSTVLEGGNTSISLKLSGPVAAVLPSAQVVQFLKTGTASGSDYSALTSITFPAGMAVGSTKSLALNASGGDNLVEGDESVILSIGDAGSMNIGAANQHQVTIKDADTAWVEFVSASSTAKEGSGNHNIAVQLRVSPASASLDVPVSVSASKVTDVSNATWTPVTTALVFAKGSTNATQQNLVYSLGTNTIFNQVAGGRNISFGLNVTAGPAGHSAGLHAFSVTEQNFEYYLATTTENSGQVGQIEILRPNGTGMDYMKTIATTSGGSPFTELTALPDGTILVLQGTTVYKVDPTVASPSFTQWSSRTDIVDLDYSAGENAVMVVTTAGNLYYYETTGTLRSSSTYPYTLSHSLNLQVGAALSAKGGVVYTSTASCGLGGCSDASGGLLDFSTNYASLSAGSSSVRTTLLNKVVGVAIDPGTNQDYALEDGECDASYTGLVKFSGSARVPVGASVLHLKSVADMTLTPDGYLLIASGADCSGTAAGDYAQLIVYNQTLNTIVHSYSFDAAGFQVTKFGGVAVLRNQVDLAP